MRQKRSLLPYLVVAAGVLIVASASIMIRHAQHLGVPSPTIAAGRLGIAALILLPLALARAGPELRTLRRRDLLPGCAAGMFLAFHLNSWIASLAYTSVASSTALVATNPLWVALASVFFFRERLPGATLVGVGITISGSALIGLSDGGAPQAASVLLGDLLALIGAVTGSAYFLIGRQLRSRLSILAYIWLAYTSAALFLGAMAIAIIGPSTLLADLGNYPAEVYLLMLGLAVGPQLLGHTSFNWALGHLSATFIVVTIMGEPIGSALLAWVVFGEQFETLQLIGFVVVLLGIVVTARGEGSEPRTKNQEPTNV